MNHNILVIGSSNTDMVVNTPRLPVPGETVLGGVFQQISGGKGANQAVAAQRCGGQVAFLACVGDDDLGKAVVAEYQKDGIDVSNIIVDSDSKSGVALILVNDDGENCIAVASGANNALTVQHVEDNAALIEQAEVILFQLETPLPTITKAIELAHEQKKTIILNPAPAQHLDDALLSKVSILTPNETEASILSGIDVIDEVTAERAARVLLKKGVEHVLITMGDLGVFYLNAKNTQMFPAYKVDAVDTTAAGDTFNGALAAGLARNKPFYTAVNYAQAAAAISVTQAGAQPSIPCGEAVVDFINKV